MHLILTGATGLIGSAVLDAMLRSPEITRISILSRRPVPMVEEERMSEDPRQQRVRVILHMDFGAYGEDVLAMLRGASGAVWALGVPQGKVGPDEYVLITKTWALAAAEAFSHITPDAPAHPHPSSSIPAPQMQQQQQQPFRFIFVSGLSATHNPGGLTPLQARVKGETELALANLVRPGRFHIEAPRPGAVDARGHADIAPYVPDPGMAARWARAAALPVMSRFAGLHSPTAELGRFLTGLALGKFDGRIETEQGGGGGDVVRVGAGLRVVTNRAMRRWMAEEGQGS